MRVLVTGHEGYIGSVLVPKLLARGYDVLGIDVGFFRNDSTQQNKVPTRTIDIRDLRHEDIQGCAAIVHLAGISNDPMSEQYRAATWDINHVAAVRLAELARASGVSRFLFASTCSVYGAASEESSVDEESPTNPLTPYAESKLLAERELIDLANEAFTPVVFRFATVYGPSPMIRTDLVVNNLVAAGLRTGKVKLQSAGLAWRPLIHVRDVANTFLAALEAPVDTVRGEVINAGVLGGNHRVADIAEAISAIIPDSRVAIPADANVDQRSYCVDFSKMAKMFPELPPRMTELSAGIAEVAACLRGVAGEDWFTSKYIRLAKLRELVDGGVLTEQLRYRR